VHPVLVELTIGGAEIVLRSYFVLLVAAALVAGGLAVRVLGGMGVPRRRAIPGMVVVVAAGLVGARTLSVALEPDRYLADPAAAFSLLSRSFALYGGLAGALLAMAGCAVLWHLPIASLADRLVIPVAAGLVLVRVGCFLNGCCAGVASSLPWAVTFPYGGSAWGKQVLGSGGTGALLGHVDAVHPTQLYEAAAVILIAVAVPALRRHAVASRIPAGSAALLFAAAFLVFRVANQALRAPTPDLAIPQAVLLGTYAVAALVATLLLIARLHRPVGERPSLEPSVADTCSSAFAR
jgi:phosphatidylglycerol---prolipoprotein diacylglyceryl transferase